MGSQASNTSYPVACVVIGGGVGGGIPKSPSFHSSLELAEATGRQIVSPENCNYFTFSSTMNNSGDEQNTANHTDKQQQSSTTNGFVAKTIQNFARFQNMTNNQQEPQTQCNTFVDNENNDTLTSSSSSSFRSSLGQGVSNSITNRINSINDKMNNGPNWGVTSNNLVKMQQTNNISATCEDHSKSLLKVSSAVNGSPSRTRDRNNLNGGVSPNTTLNESVHLPLIKGF